MVPIGNENHQKVHAIRCPSKWQRCQCGNGTHVRCSASVRKGIARLGHQSTDRYTAVVVRRTRHMATRLQSHQLHENRLYSSLREFHQFCANAVLYFFQVELKGLTNLIKFDNQGFRSDFVLDIIELSPNGMRKIGDWNSTQGVNFTRSFGDQQTEIVENLKNKTLVITMILVSDRHQEDVWAKI